jgi:acyl-CoA synthetase
MIARLEKEKMAKYKWPERLEIQDKMPRLPTGKIDRVKLVDDIKKKTAAE